ncbi:MAG: hypothetical protein JWN70_2944 [Planctomycetaceae bacterium]|nr:hypothetical protein [Planctomycetaceae bacterium]
MKRFSLSQWFECHHMRPKVTRRDRAARRQFVEVLEDRMLLAAAPTSTLDMNLDLPGDQTNRQVLVGEDTMFSVTFNNTGNALGYGPFVDLIVDYKGADGVPQFPASYFSPGSPPSFSTPFTGTPDGLGVDTNGAAINQLISATTYGQSLDLKFAQFDVTGHATHPFAKDLVGNPVIVTGPAGDVLVAARLPFGSFADDQPKAPVLFTAHVSSLADVGVGLAVQARSGFEFGTTPEDDAVAGDLSLLEAGGFHQGSVTPEVFIISKTNLAHEGETATGPNFQQQWQITVDVAAGQTVTNVDVSDSLPSNVVFVNGSLVASPAAALTLPGPTPSTTAVLKAKFASLTGVAGPDASVTFSFYVPELDASSNPVLDPTTGAPSPSINTATATGNWVPTDTRDHAGVPGSGLPIGVTGGPAVNIIADKSIAIQKSVAIVTDVGAAGPTPLDILEYSLAFQVSDYFGFQDLVIDDDYSDGQLLNGTPTLVITTNGFTTTVPLNFVSTNYTDTFSPDGDPTTHDSHHLRLDVSALLSTSSLGTGQLLGGLFTPSTSNDGPTTGLLRFRTQIQESYQEFQQGITPSLDEHDELFNKVVITGELLDSSRSVAGATQTDDSGVLFQVPVGTFTKTIYAINGNVLSPSVPPGLPPHVSPGDMVTYRLQYRLTTGDFEDFHLRDFLPHPKLLADDADADGVIGPNWTLVSGLPLPGQYSTSGTVPAPVTVSVDSTSNSLEWDFGTRVDLNNAPDTIDILFTVTATSLSFADGLFLTNEGESTHQDTHLDRVDATSLVQIISSEPNLLITKGVVATDNDNLGHGVFAPALPNGSFSDPGTAGFRYTGGSVTSANLPSLINSNLSNVDASDLVTFAIAVKNFGSDPQGAFDVTLQDMIPAGFHIPAGGLNLTVTDGTGAVLSWTGALFGAGLELSDPNATTGALDNFNPSIPGKNILFITYDLEANSAPQSPLGMSPVEACETITNTATLLAYSSRDGGAATPGQNYVSNLVTDSATVTIACPTVTKSLITTGIGPFGDTQAVIGESATFIIRLIVPEGVTSNVALVDLLPPGMAYLSSFFFGMPSDVSISGSTTAIPSGTGATFSLGTVTNTNTNNNQPDILMFSLTAVVLDVASNQDGTLLVNQAAFSVDGDLHSPVSSAPVTVIEPVLQVDKIVDQSSGVDAGDTVTFTITVSNNSPSSTDAYDVVLNDVLPAGFTYVANSLFSSGTAPAPSASSVSGGAITVNWASIPLNSSSVLIFQATLNQSVMPCEELTNTADVTWTSLPGPHGLLVGGNPDATERDGTGGSKPYNDYFAADSATVMVDCPVLEKSIVTTSEASTTGNNVAIGEIVRYRLLTSIPEGTSPSFQVIDNLPAGMMFLDDGTAKASLVSNAGFTSGLIGANATLMSTPTYGLLDGTISTSSTIDDDTYTDGTDVYFKLGTLVNNDSDANLEFVVVEFNALVLNTLSNQASVSLMNCYTVTIQPCVDFEHGVEDAFSPLLNAETTSPSTGLQQRLTNLGVLPVNIKGYDNGTPNRIFADSFTGLPTGIIGAELRFGLKPSDDIPENDSFVLGVYDIAGLPIVVSGAGNTSLFSTFVGVGNGSPGLVNNPWDLAFYPTGTVLTLDLANLPNGKSLLAAMNAGGQLDVYLQDDTAVDFMELCLTSDFSPAIQVGEDSNCVSVVVVEPDLINIGKEYTSQTAPDGTFSVNYEVSFTNASGPFSSTAFDVRIDDPLSPFFILDTANLVVKRNGLYTLVNNIDMVNVSTSNHVDLTINQLAPGDTIQLFYTVFVTSAIQPCQHITNTANVTYTSLPGGQGSVPNPTGSVTPGASGSMTGERNGSGAPLNDYFDKSVATITADCPEISKTIVTTSNPLTGSSQYNPAVTDLDVGEVVTYQVTFTLPVGTTSPAILTDNLPTGLAGIIKYVTSTIVSIGSSISSGPVVVPVVSDTDGDVLNDRVVYNFGTRTVVAGALATRQVTVQIVGQVVNSVVNTLGKVLTNTASLYYGLGTMAASVDAEIAKAKVNSSPTDITLSATTIAENNLVNAMVGTLSATDPDIGDTFTYTLVPGTGAVDNGNFSISGTTLMVIPRTDFEAKSSYSIRVQVEDQGGLMFQKMFTITVINLNEAPIIVLNLQPLVYRVSARKVATIDGSAMLSAMNTPALMFAGSVLQVSGQSSKDTLSIMKQNGISTRGKNVMFGTTIIGTVAGGTRGAPLRVELNGAATQNSVQNLLQSIGFKSTDKVAGNRMIRFQITNIGGANTNQATRQIQVAP